VVNRNGKWKILVNDASNANGTIGGEELIKAYVMDDFKPFTR
jgi:hypothetical protein